MHILFSKQKAVPYFILASFFDSFLPTYALQLSRGSVLSSISNQYNQGNAVNGTVATFKIDGNGSGGGTPSQHVYNKCTECPKHYATTDYSTEYYSATNYPTASYSTNNYSTDYSGASVQPESLDQRERRRARSTGATGLTGAIGAIGGQQSSGRQRQRRYGFRPLAILASTTSSWHLGTGTAASGTFNLKVSSATNPCNSLLRNQFLVATFG